MGYFYWAKAGIDSMVSVAFGEPSVALQIPLLQHVERKFDFITIKLSQFQFLA
jgi:hypothetical protein